MLIRLHRLICMEERKVKRLVSCVFLGGDGDGQSGAFLNTFKGAFKYNELRENPAEEKKNKEATERGGGGTVGRKKRLKI